MIVINEQTNKREDVYSLTRGIVYQDDNYVELGYFKRTKNEVLTYYKGSFFWNMSEKAKSLKLEFSPKFGKWLTFIKEEDRLNALYSYGIDNYPYNINREYEAHHNIDLMEESVRSDIYELINGADQLCYSFGVEFETAAGYIPESDCYDLGLIPLRDGSISGIEYATIPLYGEEGLSLLHEQIKTLKKHTITNKDCSIHIHFGGFPVKPSTVFTFALLWYNLQYDLLKYIPDYSYDTDNFKSNGKSYCGVTNQFASFKELYKFYTDESYMGDMYQPHPRDLEKRAKWNIKQRYYNVNFINMLCYNKAKTLEFRFLTPTYSFEKLKTFIFIFNAILKFAETIDKQCLTEDNIKEIIYKLKKLNLLTIVEVINSVYDKSLSKELNMLLEKLKILKYNQSVVGDYCGSRLDIEERLFVDGK